MPPGANDVEFIVRQMGRVFIDKGLDEIGVGIQGVTAYGKNSKPNRKALVGRNLEIVAYRGSYPDRTSEMAIDGAPNFRHRTFGSKDQSSNTHGEVT